MLNLRFFSRPWATTGCLRIVNFSTGASTPPAAPDNDTKPLSSSAAAVKSLLDDAATFDEARQQDSNKTATTSPAAGDTDWATLPYPEGTHLRRDQAQKSLRPKTDPRETTIIMFPGQGAQYVGMAAGLVKFPGARDIFELASDVLK